MLESSKFMAKPKLIKKIYTFINQIIDFYNT